MVILGKSPTLKCYMVVLHERPKNTDLAREKGSPFEVTLSFSFPSLVAPAHVLNPLYLVDVVELGIEEEW